MIKKRVAIYARVSSQRQEKDTTVENQLRDIELFIRQNKGEYQEYDRYIDSAKSGRKTTNRYEFKRMMKDAEECKFDVILVWKFDRLGRNLLDIATAIEKCKKLGIEFLSVKEATVNPATPMGSFFSKLLLLVAEFESSMIGQRVSSGMQRRKEENGSNFGRKQKLFLNFSKIYEARESGKTIKEIGNIVGLKRSRISELLKEKEKIIKLCRQGKSIREIAIELKIQERRAKKIAAYLHSRKIIPAVPAKTTKATPNYLNS
ncbi:MAG: recombinase family protein [Planctomycetes bacterium]|nr:recombinase family protein [Planctomycetota bacterium]